MENQEKIVDHIKKNPGLTQAQITYRLEIPQSTTKYHLNELIKENKIFSEKLFKIHYFPVGIEHNKKIKFCIESNYGLNDIYKNCKNETSLEEIATSSGFEARATNPIVVDPETTCGAGPPLVPENSTT